MDTCSKWVCDTTNSKNSCIFIAYTQPMLFVILRLRQYYCVKCWQLNGTVLVLSVQRLTQSKAVRESSVILIFVFSSPSPPQKESKKRVVVIYTCLHSPSVILIQYVLVFYGTEHAQSPASRYV